MARPLLSGMLEHPPVDLENGATVDGWDGFQFPDLLHIVARSVKEAGVLIPTSG